MRIVRRYLFAVLALGATQAHAQAVVNGTGARGSITQSLNFGGTTALLDSFDLDFGFGNDHHIRRVRVLPTESSSSVAISYHDQNADDAYSWRAAFYGSSNTQIVKNELSGVCRGSCTTTVPVPSGYSFVLRGFDTAFTADDHHITTIGVEHGGSTLSVYMADKNGDDEFNWTVRYALVPTSLLSASGNASGSGIGSAQAAITSGRTVIKGFMFHYSSEDHHISRIAIRPQQGTLRVNYNDQNADDGFSWRVQWANLR